MAKALSKKLGAEFLGTLSLALAVTLTLQMRSGLATPLAAGLTLALFVYTIGGVSGSHINPAVTLGLWSIKKIKTDEAIHYIIAQLIGGAVAIAIGYKLTGGTPSVQVADSLPIALAEAVGAFTLLFGICSVVYGKVSDAAAGLVVGGSLLLGITLASAASNGVLNPAVALAIGSMSPLYVFAPIVGALLGCQAGKYLFG